MDEQGRLQQCPSLISAWGYSHLSPRWRFHVHAERFAIADLPTDEAKLAAWLEYRFVQKDALLDGMQKQWLAAPGIVTKAGSSSIGWREDPYFGF